MDDFNDQLKARLKAQEDKKAAQEREKAELARLAEEKGERDLQLMTNSAAVALRNVAEQLRQQGLTVTMSNPVLATPDRTAFIHFAVEVPSPKRNGFANVAKHKERDTMVATFHPDPGGSGQLEFQLSDKPGLMREVQQWVLRLIDG